VALPDLEFLHAIVRALDDAAREAVMDAPLALALAKDGA
jgi:hypothetical protein